MKTVILSFTDDDKDKDTQDKYDHHKDDHHKEDHKEKDQKELRPKLISGIQNVLLLVQFSLHIKRLSGFPYFSKTPDSFLYV